MSYCIYVNDELQTQDRDVIYFLSHLLTFPLPKTKPRKKPEKQALTWSNFKTADKLLPKDIQTFRESFERLKEHGFLRRRWFMPTEEVYKRTREFIKQASAQTRDQIYLFY